MFSHVRSSGLLLLLLSFQALAQKTVPQKPSEGPAAPPARWLNLPEVPLTEFSAVLRGAILEELDGHLVVEKQHNWGRQTKVLSLHGLKVVQVPRNHGDWEKVRMAASDLPKSLELYACDLSSPGEDRVDFWIHLNVPAKVELRHQVWQDGVPLLASHCRGRLRIEADIAVSADMSPGSTDKTGAGAPSLKLKSVRVRCARLVAQNIDGIGGDIARTASPLLRHSFKPWQPVIEGEIQRCFVDAVAAAGNAPEVRAGVSKLMTQSKAARRARLQPEAAALARQAASLAPNQTAPDLMPAPACLALPGIYSLLAETQGRSVPDKGALNKHPPEELGTHKVFDAAPPHHFNLPTSPAYSEHVFSPVHDDEPRKR